MTGQATILVVDDDSVQRLVIDATLTRSGYTVITAENGREAVDQLTSLRRIDLVLTDLHMPEMGGAELVRMMRATPTLKGIPVIVLTGSAGENNDEISTMDGGADDYVRKPVDPMRLLARVRAALRRTDAPQAEESTGWDASELSAVKRVSRQIIVPPDVPEE